MSEIIVSGALQMSEPNTPTRAGELVQNVAEIYDIVNPRVGMVVYVAEEKKNYIITELKAVEIGGVNVPNAAVKSYELLDAATRQMIADLADDIQAEEERATAKEQELQRYANSVYEHTIATRDNLWAEFLRAEAAEKALTDKIDTLMGGVPDSALDTIKKISDWLLDDETGTQAIINKVGANTAAINAEVARAEAAEQSLQSSINAEIVRATAKEQTLETNVSKNAEDISSIRNYSYSTRDNLEAEVARATAKENELAEGIANNSKKADDAVSLALRKLFVAAGAEYNDTDEVIQKTAFWGEEVDHLPRHYYLNGLGDITEEQMAVIYGKGNTLNLGYNLNGYIGRTNLPFLSIKSTTNLEGYYYAYGCFAEVINLGLEIDSLIAFNTSDKTERTFASCSKLKAICGRFYFGIAPKDTIFYNSKLLQYINITKLKYNISFYTNPIISKESIIYMIQNATPSSAITITLHANAYARLNPDLEENADIKSALEAQPLITLASA